MSNAVKDIFSNKAGWKKVALPLAVLGGLGLAGCSDDADIASRNISKAADNFEIVRRVVFYNGITDKIMLTIEGRCSIKADRADKQLEVTCKIGPKAFRKHFLGISDNVSYMVQQLKDADVSVYRHRMTFKPEQLIPNIDIRTSVTKQVPVKQPNP